MSVILVRIFASVFLSITGLFVAKKTCNSNELILSPKSITFLIFLIVIPVMIYSVEYSYLYSIIVYFMMFITYRYILNINIVKSIIICAITMFVISIVDLLVASLLINFITLSQIRTIWYINIIFNTLISLISYLILTFKPINKFLKGFLNKIENKKIVKFILFAILSVILICTVIYTISLDCKLSTIFSFNFLVLVILFILLIILISEKRDYDTLSDEYDNLFNYVKVFEEWIEKEQFIRHEYKNQLAVLRCMTKEKKVKEKIDSIIADNINIDSGMISELKCLPNGGLKGLLYYKIALAKNKNVNIEVDTSDEAAPILKKLKEDQLKTLSKLLGVYLDNAIEASIDTKKKIVSIEIYQYNNIVKFVISNTYNNKKDIQKRHEKGVSTKGNNRGYGLYFANKLLYNNNWIEYSQSTIDQFYIVKISINIQKNKM